MRNICSGKASGKRFKKQFLEKFPNKIISEENSSTGVKKKWPCQNAGNHTRKFAPNVPSGKQKP
jgi:hypothetical protein